MTLMSSLVLQRLHGRVLYRAQCPAPVPANPGLSSRMRGRKNAAHATRNVLLRLAQGLLEASSETSHYCRPGTITPRRYKGSDRDDKERGTRGAHRPAGKQRRCSRTGGAVANQVWALYAVVEGATIIFFSYFLDGREGRASSR